MWRARERVSERDKPLNDHTELDSRLCGVKVPKIQLPLTQFKDHRQGVLAVGGRGSFGKDLDHFEDRQTNTNDAQDHVRLHVLTLTLNE